jgi:CBS domain-containing protein
VRVADFMSVQLVECSSDSTIGAAARRMVTANVGSVLVCDDHRLTGIFTERDVLRLVSERCDLEVEQVGAHVSQDLVTVPPDASLEDAATLLNEHRIRHLPVVDGATPVGMLSLRDFFVARRR